MKKILILLSLMLCFGSASAVNTNEFISAFEGEAEQKKVAEIYIAGVGLGIRIVNAHSLRTNGLSFFCVPLTLALNYTNYYDVIKKEYDKYPNLHKDLSVETTLLYGLMSTFPCRDQ